jgi:hypothetical protein
LVKGSLLKMYLKAEESGQYGCRADNGIGEGIEKQIELTLKGRSD